MRKVRRLAAPTRKKGAWQEAMREIEAEEAMGELLTTLHI
jgi:hypothetical protein